ncbi:hypothetical protein, partial [Gordonibacter sp.]
MGTHEVRANERSRGVPAVLRQGRLSVFGLLFTHVWIYCVLHRANLDAEALPAEGTFYAMLSLFLVLAAAASYRRPPRGNRTAASIAVACLMVPATVALVLSPPIASDALRL